ETRDLSRITELLSGVIAVTPLSPVISWSRSGRLVFTYFSNAGYEPYIVDDPLSLPRRAVPVPLVAQLAQPPANGSQVDGIAANGVPVDVTPVRSDTLPQSADTPPLGTDTVAAPVPERRSAFITSYYRTEDGEFR